MLKPATVNDRFPSVPRIGILRSSVVRVDEESRHAVDELGDMRFMHKSLRAPGREWGKEEGWNPGGGAAAVRYAGSPRGQLIISWFLLRNQSKYARAGTPTRPRTGQMHTHAPTHRSPARTVFYRHIWWNTLRPIVFQTAEGLNWETTHVPLPLRLLYGCCPRVSSNSGEQLTTFSLFLPPFSSVPCGPNFIVSPT